MGKPEIIGDISSIDPEFEAFKDGFDHDMDRIWTLPPAEMKIAMSAPGPLPGDIPQDLSITHLNVPVEDGTQIQLRIYRSASAPTDALLYLKSHGGGWFTGNHDSEEAENRFVAARNEAVVISVNYRL